MMKRDIPICGMSRTNAELNGRSWMLLNKNNSLCCRLRGSLDLVVVVLHWPMMKKLLWIAMQQVTAQEYVEDDEKRPSYLWNGKELMLN